MVKKISEKFPFLWLFIVLAIVVAILDQLLKFLVLEFKPTWDLKLVWIHLITNTGAGFGILQGKTLILAMVSLVVALVVVFFYKKIPQEKGLQVYMGLFLGGIVGNFIDRYFRGYVVDFIDFKFWPAFNLADMMITISVIGLVIYIWKE